MSSRRPLVLLVLGLWVLLGPIAMAFASCEGMCEAPCGLLFAMRPPVASVTLLEPGRDLAPPERPGLPAPPGQVLEPPPKSPSLSA
jgi:hypothetical protein